MINRSRITIVPIIYLNHRTFQRSVLSCGGLTITLSLPNRGQLLAPANVFRSFFMTIRAIAWLGPRHSHWPGHGLGHGWRPLAVVALLALEKPFHRGDIGGCGREMSREPRPHNRHTPTLPEEDNWRKYLTIPGRKESSYFAASAYVRTRGG